jgi:hypothetical protein
MTGMIVACVEKDSERGRLAKSNAHISFEFFLHLSRQLVSLFQLTPTMAAMKLYSTSEHIETMFRHTIQRIIWENSSATDFELVPKVERVLKVYKGARYIVGREEGLLYVKELFAAAEREYEEKNREKQRFPRPTYCMCVRFSFLQSECEHCWLSQAMMETIYFRSLYIPMKLNSEGIITLEQQDRLGEKFIVCMKRNLRIALTLRGDMSEQELIYTYQAWVLYDVKQMLRQHRLPPLSPEDEWYFRVYSREENDARLLKEGGLNVERSV